MNIIFISIVFAYFTVGLMTDARIVIPDGQIQSIEKRNEAHEETAFSADVPSSRIGAIHWNWAPRARALVDYIISIWYTRLNTYYDHPSGYGLDHVSVDCWDMKGRGYALAESIGDPISEYLVASAQYWGVRWVIWWGWIWTPASGWQRYTDPSDMHYDHVHVTIW